MSFGIPVRNGLSVGLLASTYLSSRRTAYPAMSLNFLQPFLDSRITFSRGSNATRVDATGKIVYAPANLLTFSEQFDNAAWTKQANVSVTGVNVGVAPNGTTTADEVTFTATTNDSIYQGILLPANTTYAFSVWVKGLGGQVVQVSAQPNAAVPTFTPVTLNGQWQRVTAIATTGATAGTLNAVVDLVSGSTPAVVQLWGAQLEPVTYQTTPSTYVATTASAYYGPRFDYDPVTLAPKGLLIEEARTNLVTYSEQFDNASWTKVSATITANVGVAPNGTTTADLMALTSGGGRVQVATTTTSSTASIYVKFVSGTGLFAIDTNGAVAADNTLFNLNTGTVTTTGANNSNSTITPVGNGWYRVSTTRGATAGGTLYFGLASGSLAGDQILLYGAQLEAGSFATSYIPTVASTVTRSADIATMTGTNFSSWYNQSEGTFVVDFTPDEGLVNNATRVLSTTSGGVSNRVVDIGIIGTNWVNYNGTNSTAIGAASVTSVPQRIAAAYATANYGYVLNGGTVATDSSALVNSPTQLSLGQLSFTSYLNGHIRQIAYYNTRLPNVQLQTLTAPSLATTLSLSFTNQAYTVGV